MRRVVVALAALVLAFGSVQGSAARCVATPTPTPGTGEADVAYLLDGGFAGTSKYLFMADEFATTDDARAMYSYQSTHMAEFTGVPNLIEASTGGVIGDESAGFLGKITPDGSSTAIPLAIVIVRVGRFMVTASGGGTQAATLADVVRIVAAHLATPKAKRAIAASSGTVTAGSLLPSLGEMPVGATRIVATPTPTPTC